MVFGKSFSIQTKGFSDILDITEKISELVFESGAGPLPDPGSQPQPPEQKDTQEAEECHRDEEFDQREPGFGRRTSNGRFHGLATRKVDRETR